MNIHCTYTDLVDPASLTPNHRNPNRHPDRQIALLAKMIEHQGWRTPITVSNRSGFVVRGHGRLQAALKLGVELVPVDRQDYAAEADEWSDLVADNRIAELVEMDDDLLKGLLQELDASGLDMDLTGFDESALDDLLSAAPQGEVREDDFDAEAAAESIAEPATKSGNIWLLGRHRLMCGDSTKAADVLRLMDGKTASLIVTDPPYNVDYRGKTQDALPIQNDSMDDGQFYAFLLAAYSNMYMTAEDGAPIYVFHADSEGTNFRKAMKDAGWKLAQCCVWVKQSMVLGRQDYQWQHEPVLYGWKPTGPHHWHSDRKQTTIWNFDRPMASREHPTMKPIDLLAYPIQNSSVSNCIVQDLFGGSGSTLMACEQLNRICYTMELDPVYCDVIVKRWEQFTSKKAELIKE
jgi:DNA modification methylase